MYTEFIFGCELSKNTPKVCIDALDSYINYDKKPKYENPEGWEQEKYNKEFIEITSPKEEIEKFAEEYDFGRLFNSCSAYFGAANPVGRFYYDHISDSYHISTRADCKYGSSNIPKFLEYIKPYVIHGSGWPHRIYAYVQYEEDEFPTVYAMDGIYKNPMFEDDNRLEKSKERIKHLYDTLSKIYMAVDPDWSVTEEVYAKHGITDPKDYGKENYDTIWRWFAEHLEEKFGKKSDEK